VLTVLPGLQINVARGVLSTEETLLLETWAEKESETLWRLNRDKALCAMACVGVRDAARLRGEAFRHDGGS
jgi:hypothetical protein